MVDTQPCFFRQHVPKAPVIKHHSLFETYLSNLEKSRKCAHSSFRVSSSVCTTDIISLKKWLKDEGIYELNVRVFKLETIIQVLARERNEEYRDLIQPHYSDELRLCLEDEERMLLEQEKNIIEEQKFRVEEANMISTLLFYANGDKYATPWSDVDQVFFPINETAQHWCLAHLDLLFGLVRNVYRNIFPTCLYWICSEIIEYKWALFYCLPNKSLEQGLKLIHTDNDVHSFFVDAERSGKMYITHKHQDLMRIIRKGGKTIKKGLRKKAKGEQKMVDDAPVGRKSVQTSRKGKEIMYESSGPSPIKKVSVADELVLDDNWKYKGLDVDDVHENFVYNAHSHPNMDKERFSNNVVLDDVVTDTLAYTLPLVLKKKCRNKVNVTRKRICLNNSKTMKLKKRLREKSCNSRAWSRFGKIDWVECGCG
nr:phospholipase-like protein [Tanacetum cinerariifolium]